MMAPLIAWVTSLWLRTVAIQGPPELVASEPALFHQRTAQSKCVNKQGGASRPWHDGKSRAP